MAATSRDHHRIGLQDADNPAAAAVATTRWS